MTNGSDLPGRVQRIEEFVQVLTNEHIEFQRELKHLLTAQVVMQDSMKEGFERLTQAQIATEERLNALIEVVDGIIKRPPETT
jgi:hypothetical protein